MAWHLGAGTDKVARYLRLKFNSLQTHSNELVDVPPSWSLDYLTEVDLAANILYQAYNNQGSFDFPFPISLIDIRTVCAEWDMVRYSDHIIGHRKIGDDLEENLKAKFPPLFVNPKLCILPGIVTDKFGKVLVWYLPAILQPARQVMIHFSCLYTSQCIVRHLFLTALDHWRRY